ncbi:hypothetical protein M6B38_278035 [Iris pallida]|uniref:Uncharacterized protein n=1 Tax=Iris pallida TaxID=29817 RepID=A0AAX6E1D9_IRIPA|nr:hypothetical protein M6B38_214945 [Iris pallida]KAJ6847337.1 hypothetical protein M6B38_278035 [Iris pallida]
MRRSYVVTFSYLEFIDEVYFLICNLVSSSSTTWTSTNDLQWRGAACKLSGFQFPRLCFCVISLNLCTLHV